MAAAVTKPGTPTATSAGQAPTGPKKPGKLLMFGAALLTVMAIQIAVTELLLMPGQSESDASKTQEKKEAQAASGAGHSQDKTTDRDLSEVSLGNFSFSNRGAVAGVVVHVDFELAAVVSPSQASILESQARNHRGRIREAINTIVRNCSYEELIDPNLATLKRLVREEINRLLDESLVADVVINDIRVMEQ